MISDKDLLVNRFISVPKDSGLNCAAFVAGIVDAILEGANFVCSLRVRVRVCVILACCDLSRCQMLTSTCSQLTHTHTQPARVTAHTTDNGTTILIKFEASVIARERQLEGR